MTSMARRGFTFSSISNWVRWAAASEARTWSAGSPRTHVSNAALRVPDMLLNRPAVHSHGPFPVAQGAHRPARASVRQSGQRLGFLCTPLSRGNEGYNRWPAQRRHPDDLTARKACGEQMVGIRGGQDQHGIGRRLFQRFEQAILGGLGQPFGVGQQRNSQERHEWLETQELLERLVVRLRPALWMKADLVNAD